MSGGTSPRYSSHDANAAVGVARLNVGIEVSEVCCHECIGTSEEMIEDHGREPILEMSAACPHAIREILVPGAERHLRFIRDRINYGITRVVEHGNRNGITSRLLRFVEIDPRLCRHCERSDLAYYENARCFLTAKAYLAKARQEE